MSEGADDQARAPVDILGLTRDGLRAAAARLIPSASGASDQVYASVFKAGRFEPEALGLGSAKASAWRKAFKVSRLRPETLAEEGQGGERTAKALLRLEDGLAIECVRIPMGTTSHEEGRATLCLSSQVGCAMGCAFCETGRQGLRRSLTAGEIVGQVMAARHGLGWSFRNVVFMGMGEALDNLGEVGAAIEVLMDDSGLNLAQDRITLCTVGHVAGLEALARKSLGRLNLSVSLNAGHDAVRDSLMPVNRRWPLRELKAALQAYPRGPRSVLALNYCLIPGLNDGPEHLEGIAAFCEGLGRVYVNLIPYNPGKAPIGTVPSEAQVEAFTRSLAAKGLTVRVRTTRGRTIGAACGQLAGRA